MAIVLRASKVVMDYGTNQRQYCAKFYSSDQLDIMIQRVSGMFKSPSFIQLMSGVPVDSDKVCRIFANLGSLLLTALKLIGQKTIHYYKILFYLREVKMVYEEVKRKQLTHQTSQHMND